jgi:hypothetical protein
MVRKAISQSGVSPRVVAAAVTGIAVFLFTKLGGLTIDPVIEQAINVVAMVIAAAVVGPGTVVVEPEAQPEFADTPLPPEVPNA